MSETPQQAPQQPTQPTSWADPKCPTCAGTGELTYAGYTEPCLCVRQRQQTAQQAAQQTYLATLIKQAVREALIETLGDIGTAPARTETE